MEETLTQSQKPDDAPHPAQPPAAIPPELFAQIVSLHQAGRLNEAEVLYKKILDVYPANMETLNLLGVLQIQKGNMQEAVRLLDQVISINPSHVEAHSRMGLALFNLKRYDEALSSYGKAINSNPDCVETRKNRGFALYTLGRYPEAVADYDRAIAIHPHHAEAYASRGHALYKLKKYREALADYDKAIALNPEYAEAHNNRGNTLNELKQPIEAIASFDKAISLRPGYAEPFNNRGITLHAMQQYGDALQDYDKALAIQPDHAQAHNNRGITLHMLNRHEEALTCINSAIALMPGFASAYNNRGVTFVEMKQYQKAMADYETAIALDPDCAEAYWDKGLLKILLGEYAEGWKLHEWRWKHGEGIRPRQFSQPLWLGKESLKGKTILLHEEQGLGDTIQFCRYVPMVEALGAKVILLIPRSMPGLLSSLGGAHQLITDSSEAPAFDFHCPLMSLPHAFGTTLDTVPSAAYLSAPPAYVEKWQPILDAQLGKKSRIGLCWAGGIRPNQPQCVRLDALRSLHFSGLKPLLDTPDTAFVSLQLGPQKDQRDDARVLDISSKLKDWSDTAAVISLLDLVISVDTSVLHVAAAMGKKTWLLNRYNTCWRWLVDRSDSPWYPSLTQFRQPGPGDWNSVIEKVKAELISGTASVRKASL